MEKTRKPEYIACITNKKYVLKLLFQARECVHLRVIVKGFSEAMGDWRHFLLSRLRAGFPLTSIE